jgi:DNA-binding NarL/FixJ family response regulator
MMKQMNDYLINKFLAFFLLLVTLFIFSDIYGEAREYGMNLHLVVEIMIGIISGGIFIFLLSSIRQTKVDLQSKIKDIQQLNMQSEKWKAEAQKHIQGLSMAIDKQFDVWHLSKAEKEVAYLLLKGLSLKEAADVRSTSEKTVRAQAQAIYEKSGLSSRSELSAFFLEDLLAPKDDSHT